MPKTIRDEPLSPIVSGMSPAPDRLGLSSFLQPVSPIAPAVSSTRHRRRPGQTAATPFDGQIRVYSTVQV